MKFTGKNLVLVEYALRLAASDLQMEIGSCPDHKQYAEEIAELFRDLAALDNLHAKVLKRLIADHGEPL